MAETVSSETIESLAAKLAGFADTLSDDERHALDLCFLRQAEVEGFSLAVVNQSALQVRFAAMMSDILRASNDTSKGIAGNLR